MILLQSQYRHTPYNVYIRQGRLFREIWVSVRSFLEFIDDKFDVLQDYVTTRSPIHTMFVAGATSAAFGAAADAPDLGDIGVILWASSSIVSGTCMAAKGTARMTKTFPPGS